jgi:hypothetical protein
MIFPFTLWSRSLCAASGALAGGFAGAVLGLLQTPPNAIVLSAAQALRVGLVLGLVGWLLILLVIGVWFHYGVGTIAGPALVNAILSALLTVLLCEALHVPILDALIGLLAGTLVGWILCLLCGRFENVKGATR